MSDQRTADGLDHLQSAALEMISAARLFLDAMEEVVTDRTKVSSVVEAVGSMAQGAMRAAAKGASGASATTRPPGDVDDPLASPIEHIDIS